MAVPSKLYHWTSMASLIGMANSNSISMSVAYGSPSEEEHSMGKYPFFLSTTSYSTNAQGYAQGKHLYVRLEMDTSYMANKGVFRRIDQVKVGKASKAFEAEERFLTKFAALPFDKAVSSVYVSEGMLSSYMASWLKSKGVPFFAKDGIKGNAIFSQYNEPLAFGFRLPLSLLKLAYGNEGFEKGMKALTALGYDRNDFDGDAGVAELRAMTYIEIMYMMKYRESAILFRPYFVKAISEGKKYRDYVLEVAKMAGLNTTVR